MPLAQRERRTDGGTAMGSVVVCGGGMVGSLTAMMLAADGHDVTVLEADPVGPGEIGAGAWGSWDRKGVAQFHQPHSVFPKFRHVLDAELPGLNERLAGAGCAEWDVLAALPPTLTDTTSRPDDADRVMLTGRRPVMESVVAAAAGQAAGVTVRRGVRVRELVAGTPARPGVPHVTGVVTADGEHLGADLVIDASGRRTCSGDWLAALGARPPYTESEDRGFVYYSRYFTGPRPAQYGPALMPVGSISYLTLVSDNDTWSVTLYARSGDAPLKALRNTDAFTRVATACPLAAHWVDATPISDVVAMAGIVDSYRRFVVDGEPVVTGFAAVGDAWASTNPSAGRGITIGVVQAQALRQGFAAHGGDPVAFAHAYDGLTEERAAPFHRVQVGMDSWRIAEMAAFADGTEPPAPDPAFTPLEVASAVDADAFRGLLDIILCLAQPEEVMARPAVAAAVRAAAGVTPQPFPGPDRAQLLALIAG